MPSPPPTRFWYLSWNDGRTGYLLDLIARPQEAVARLAVFRRGQAPAVHRRRFRPDEVTLLDGGAGAAMGPCRIDGAGCECQVGGLALSARLGDARREVTLVPRWVAWLFPRVPALWSVPSTVVDATAEGVGYRGVPCARTRYQLSDVARARWFIVSAQGFDGRDARCEIAGGWLLGRWATSGYLHLGERSWPLSQPLANLFRFHVAAAGARERGQRRFRVDYRSPRLSLRMDAQADEAAFVELEREGATTVHTTLFGDCRLEVNADGQADELTARGTCLLEVKEGAAS